MSVEIDLERRRRWMRYPIYVTVALICVHVFFFSVTLNETREFIGKKGVEYCWAYTSFQRYIFSHLASIGCAIVMLSVLYWLAQRNYLLPYLAVWAVWLIASALLSFLGLSFC